MNSIYKKTVQLIRTHIYTQFRQGLNRRYALGLSISLHIFITLAMASMFTTKYLITPESDENIIELDLFIENESDRQRVVYSSNPTNSLSQISTDVESSGAKSGAANRDKIIMAALTTLSQLKESFNFTMQTVSADTLDVFSPIQSNAPDITSLIADLNKNIISGNRGRGKSVTGGGGGNCPPGDGGILK